MAADDEEDDDLLLLLFIFAGVTYYNSLRNRSKLTRPAILQPAMSSWNRLFNFGNDSSFLEMTGFTRAAFVSLREDVFSPRIARYGRPR